MVLNHYSIEHGCHSFVGRECKKRIAEGFADASKENGKVASNACWPVSVQSVQAWENRTCHTTF